VALLESKGFKSYLVGGCVRDLIMKRPLTDIDITTDATPDQVMDIFAGREIFAIPTGLDHGTVTVVVNGNNIEVTTFRTGVSSDGRKSKVGFGKTLEEDLLRRDFTINAIAFNPTENSYIDPYGGQRDIKKGLIKAVGTPLKRFREDYLRMFRAHRFEAVLEFTMAPETLAAVKSAAGEKWQKVISVERIREEINKCFKQAKAPSIMIEGMRKSGILESVLPELTRCRGFEQNRHHEFDIYTHTLHTIDAVPKGSSLIRWAALIHDLGKVDACENYGPEATFYGHEKISYEMGRKILKRMKFGNTAAKHILNLVKHHMYNYVEGMRDASVRRLAAAVGEENMEDFCMLRRADSTAKTNGFSPDSEGNEKTLLERVRKIAADDKLFKIRDLAIGGREIMEIKNINASPEVGAMLRRLHEMVLDDPSKNTREILVKIVKDTDLNM